MTSALRRTRPTPAPDWVYFGARGVFHGLARLLIRLEVTGHDNVPSGPYLAVINHLSIVDTVLMCVVLPHRLTALGADKWRRVPGIRHIMEMMGVVWVARGEADADAIKAALSLLKSGRQLGLAPEGTRSRHSHALQPGKPGAAYLADRARVPVLPVAFAGTERAVEAWLRLRRPRVKCVIGRPFLLPGDGRAKGAKLDALTDLIMCHIAALLPPEYRGVYADHPMLPEVLAGRSSPGTQPPAPGTPGL